MSEGYIKLHRSLLDWGWHTDSKVLSLFVHLLMMANYEDRDWLGMVVKRGQIATSLARLSVTTGESIQNIRTCLRKLESTGEITSITTNKYRLITICNYDKYQSIDDCNQQAEQQATNNQLTINQQQLKKERNKERDIVVINARDYLYNLSDYWREQVKMEVGRITGRPATDEELNLYIDNYQSHITISGFKNIENYQAHFANWLRLRLLSESKQKESRSKQYQNDGKEKMAKLPDGFSIYG